MHTFDTLHLALLLAGMSQGSIYLSRARSFSVVVFSLPEQCSVFVSCMCLIKYLRSIACLLVTYLRLRWTERNSSSSLIAGEGQRLRRGSLTARMHWRFTWLDRDRGDISSQAQVIGDLRFTAQYDFREYNRMSFPLPCVRGWSRGNMHRILELLCLFIERTYQHT